MGVYFPLLVASEGPKRGSKTLRWVLMKGGRGVQRQIIVNQLDKAKEVQSKLQKCKPTMQ